jgi:hypothetical protein
MIRTTTRGNLLKVTLPTTELPNTSFVTKQHPTRTFEGKEAVLFFTPSDYCELATYLKDEFSYNKVEARSIISWIHDNVASKNDGMDWSPAYLEIIEGANDDTYPNT